MRGEGGRGASNHDKTLDIFSFLVSKLLYKSKCLSVCQPRLGGNVIFSASNWDIPPPFFVQIPLINEHIFCKYFVCLSVGNGTKLCYLWIFSSLFLYNTPNLKVNFPYRRVGIKSNFKKNVFVYVTKSLTSELSTSYFIFESGQTYVRIETIKLHCLSENI